MHPSLSVLFISPLHLPLSSIRIHPQRSPRRFRAVACASNPSPTDDVSQPGDPAWLQMAHQIHPQSPAEPQSRPQPQWVFPEGKLDDDAEESAWNQWNSAKQDPDELTPRDPKAETDFWRSAARNIVDDDLLNQPSVLHREDPLLSDATNPIPESPNAPSPSTPSHTPDQLSDSDISDENIWQMARGVTGEMTSLQNRLRDELDHYDPYDSKDQYRQIARELVGPADDEPWEDVDPVRLSDETQTGSGWNPDVDWKRYDDVYREQNLSKEASQRRAAEESARKSMEDAQNTESSSTLSGMSFPAEGAVEFNNDSGDQGVVPTNNEKSDVGGEVPRFLSNKQSGGSIYRDTSSVQENIEALQREGIPLRDPKKDTEQWRSAAKELSESFAEPDSANDSSGSSTEKQSDVRAGASKTGEEESEKDAWQSWRLADSKWEKSAEVLSERDPQQEVDMWRASARELTSNSGTNSTDEKTVSESNTSSSDEASVWSRWRSADAQWKQSVAKSDAELGKMESQISSVQKKGERVDWGDGLGDSKSEEAAWDMWNAVSGSKAGKAVEKQKSSKLTASGDGQVEDSGERDARLNNNSSVSSWRSFAREMAKESQDADVHGGE